MVPDTGVQSPANPGDPFGATQGQELAQEQESPLVIAPDQQADALEEDFGSQGSDAPKGDEQEDNIGSDLDEGGDGDLNS